MKNFLKKVLKQSQAIIIITQIKIFVWSEKLLYCSLQYHQISQIAVVLSHDYQVPLPTHHIAKRTTTGTYTMTMMQDNVVKT